MKKEENLIKLELTPYHFQEIIKKGYDLNILFLLKLLENSIFIGEDNAKLDNIYQTMQRKGLITENLENLTLEGKALLEFLNTEGEVKLIKKKSTAGPIEAFWKVFPSTDTFEHKGRKFQGSRALKADKENCKLKLESILNEGEYTLDEIIKAVEYDVLMKKEESVKKGQNKLTYIQNSLTYLRQRSFEPFIELIKEGKEVKQNQNTEFDGVNI